jgi:hypothetical protein
MTRRSDGTFLPGFSLGKPRGVRNRLAHQVFVDAFAHWSEPEPTNHDGKTKGQIALELLYREKPAEYCRLFSGLLPRHFEHSVAEPDDEQRDEMLLILRDAYDRACRNIEQREAVPLLPVKEVVND